MARKRRSASPPGAASQRTDLAAHNQQPVVDIPAQRHGQAQALEAQQQAAPLRGPGAAGTAAQQRRGAPAPLGGQSIFRPSERPGEAATSGIPLGAGHSGQNSMIPTDTVDDFLRSLYSVLPSDAILRLLKD